MGDDAVQDTDLLRDAGGAAPSIVLPASAGDVLGKDPRSGAFSSSTRRATVSKALWWDRTGYGLLCNRLERSMFRLPSACVRVMQASRSTRGSRSSLSAWT